MEYMITNHSGFNFGKVTSNCTCIEIELDRKEVFTLFGGHQGAMIENMKGILWITQEGDHEDHMIDEGQSFIISQSGKIVMQGQPTARVRVIPADEVQSRSLSEETMASVVG